MTVCITPTSFKISIPSLLPVIIIVLFLRFLGHGRELLLRDGLAGLLISHEHGHVDTFCIPLFAVFRFSSFSRPLTHGSFAPGAELDLGLASRDILGAYS